ncbi:MAG: class I SAM-dependent methyltransferase [Euryarchaeota archaeon]|nr:MAG: hypothetical protein C5S47_06930 [ANME-2 cluster archaeon]MEA1865650.1 class I SAM-dependent methyltransferase [Euryarchaeota archaeon]
MSELNTKKPDHYREDCNRIASVYDPLVRSLSSFFGGEHSLRILTIEKMELKPHHKILDVCCGTGTLCAMIAETIGGEGEVVGIDLAENMLKLAEKKRRGNTSFSLANAEEVPYPDEYFDCACITFGLHEMPHPVRMNVLREMRRVLKAGGRIVVLDYLRPTGALVRSLFNVWMLVEGVTARDFIKRDLSSIVRDSGFDSVEPEIHWMETLQIVRGRKCKK